MQTINIICDACHKSTNASDCIEMQVDDKMHDFCPSCHSKLEKLLRGTGRSAIKAAFNGSQWNGILQGGIIQVGGIATGLPYSQTGYILPMTTTEGLGSYTIQGANQGIEAGNSGSSITSYNMVGMNSSINSLATSSQSISNAFTMKTKDGS